MLGSEINFILHYNDKTDLFLRLTLIICLKKRNSYHLYKKILAN